VDVFKDSNELVLLETDSVFRNYLHYKGMFDSADVPLFGGYKLFGRGG
jgi:hypothetical protein